MPKFKYSAIDIKGREIEGVLEARDRKDAVDAIRQKQFYPVAIRSAKEPRDISKLYIFPSITSKDLSVFCRQYASVLKAGVPSVQGLYILIDQTENLFLKQTLQKVYFLIQGGHSLSQAMREQGSNFPIMLIRTIESGEWSGTLDLSFERMADYFERQYKLVQKVHKALAYPIFLVITSILVVSFLMHVVVPQFTVLFDSAEAQLPIYTRILLGLDDFFAHNLILLLSLPAVLYLICKLALSYNKSRIFLHRVILKIPYIGNLIKKVVSARFNRTMSILISSGISITQALTISSNVTKNEFISKGLTQSINMLQQGKGLAKSLRVLGIFSPEIINVIAVGEESGRVEEMMDKIADICELEAESAIDKFVSLLEPISILILGGIIAFIVLSVAMPMFQMYVFLD